jgi:hypothetical protein
MKVSVESYAADWNPKTNIGKIAVKIQGKEYPLPIETVDEFTATLLLLSKTGVIADITEGDFELPFRPVGT